jgi:hypothetical protein
MRIRYKKLLLPFHLRRNQPCSIYDGAEWEPSTVHSPYTLNLAVLTELVGANQVLVIVKGSERLERVPLDPDFVRSEGAWRDEVGSVGGFPSPSDGDDGDGDGDGDKSPFYDGDGQGLEREDREVRSPDPRSRSRSRSSAGRSPSPSPARGVVAGGLKPEEREIGAEEDMEIETEAGRSVPVVPVALDPLPNGVAPAQGTSSGKGKRKMSEVEEVDGKRQRASRSRSAEKGAGGMAGNGNGLGSSNGNGHLARQESGSPTYAGQNGFAGSQSQGHQNHGGQVEPFQFHPGLPMGTPPAGKRNSQGRSSVVAAALRAQAEAAEEMEFRMWEVQEVGFFFAMRVVSRVDSDLDLLTFLEQSAGRGKAPGVGGDGRPA